MTLVQYHSFAQPLNTDNRSIYYGCGEYGGLVHCDRLNNKFESYEFKSESSMLYNSTDIPNFVPGINGKALEMHGNSLKSITFANTSLINYPTFSVAFWIKNIKSNDETESPPIGNIISQINGENTAGWGFRTLSTSSGNTVELRVYNNQGESFSSAQVPISNDSYSHIVGSFNGSSIKIYENGTLAGETKFNGTYNNNINVPIRLGVASNSPMLFFWTGEIADLRMYNKSVSPVEIQRIISNGSSIGNLSDNMIGHWRFNGNLDDSSGNNHHGKEYTLISSMVFAPDGKMFFAEKDTGNIRLMIDDKVRADPFTTISDYYSNWEQGLLGLAVDPKYEQNHFIYLYYTTSDYRTKEPFNRVVRFTDENNKGVNQTIILDSIPASKGYHSGGAMAFGPDDKLYISVGDATQNTKCSSLPSSNGTTCPAQDPNSLLGKILRINSDGTIPKDNPYPNSPVYNLGHVNMYGIAFNTQGYGLVSENGDALYDEINTLEGGGNYGAPTLQPLNIDPGLSNSSIKPLRSYYLAKCLTQLIYYDGDKIPQLQNKFLVGSLSGNIINGQIFALEVNSTSNQIIEEGMISLYNFPNNEVITLAKSPEGDMYYAGYSINKLESVDTSSKVQTLFPIEINQSSPVRNISGVYFNSSANKLFIDVGSSPDLGNQSVRDSENVSSPVNLQIKVPTSLLDGIFSVASEDDVRNLSGSRSSVASLEHSIQENRLLGLSIVDVTLEENTDYLVSITGNSSAFEKML